MTRTEISTLAKAGYVVVAAEGQNQTTLQVLSEMFTVIIPGVNPQLVKEGEAMSMKRMIDNLLNFSIPHPEATLLLKTLADVFEGGKGYQLAIELQNVLRTKSYSSYEMPELAKRIKSESFLFGSDSKDQTDKIHKKHDHQESLKFLNIGKSKLQNNNFEGAIVDFNRAISLNPKLEEAYFARAKAKKGLSDYDGSIDDYAIVIELNPKNANAHNNLGNLLYNKGMISEAAINYRCALALKPGFDVARKNLNIIEKNLL
jgi:tetratricopeptide (TPR) repeat protein